MVGSSRTKSVLGLYAEDDGSTAEIKNRPQ